MTTASKNTADYLDRYYTCEDVMKWVADDIQRTVTAEDGDIKIEELIDFSGGDGRLGEILKSSSSSIKYVAFDIKPTEKAKKKKLVTQRDWKDVKRGDVTRNQALCLNPPFGRAGITARQFIEHGIDIANPMYMFLILPIRNWVFEGWDVLRQTRLPPPELGIPAAFVLPDTGDEYKVASEYVVLKRNASIPRTKPTIVDRMFPPVMFVSDTGKLDPSLKVGDSSYTPGPSITYLQLLVRKVGAYAGCQTYCLAHKSDSDRDSSRTVSYVDAKGHVSDSADVDLGGDGPLTETPWADNGHIVCDRDVPEREYLGSNPDASGSSDKRQGTGFLKVYFRKRKTLEQLQDMAKKLHDTISMYGYAVGAPKKVSKAIVERVLIETSGDVIGKLPQKRKLGTLDGFVRKVARSTESIVHEIKT